MCPRQDSTQKGNDRRRVSGAVAIEGAILVRDGKLTGYAGLAREGAITFERITVKPDKMDGQPCIRGLRIPVATVVSMVADGMTTEEIVAELPDLEPEDAAEALHYAAEALRERQLPLRRPA